ncbi:hydrolase, alpha/beta fold family protein [Cardiosporidium cionae]|uniref:Hydrolase, alpha/beta fold family protein n=1 Tax=Cardiosporidium cionae TaxID=476202 RepID=A0ABQ7JA11_9APIC|nr:hydrolase, alpha/beta fold family protein [Cardiosporidium cionae]|eukprot:KAF8820816.1 hydrolase, alpha/beta fold family protein [Cardiosporidium cionae]
MSGNGIEAVILVHGMCMSSTFWADGLLRYIKVENMSRFTFYCPDLLGYGKSNHIKSKDNYSRNEQVSLILRDVVLKFGLLTYHLVGHSFGAIICLNIGARNPGAVKTMTLFSPSYFESERQAYQILTSIPFPVSHVRCYISLVAGNNRSILKRMEKGVARQTNLLLDLRMLIPSTVSNPELGHFMIRLLNFFRPWLAPVASKIIPGSEMPELSVWDFFAIDPDATLGTVNTIIYDRVEQCLDILRYNQVRVYVAHGNKDGVVPFRQGQALADRYPNVVLRVLPGLVHHFPVSHARLSADILLHELMQYYSRSRSRILHAKHQILDENITIGLF